MMRAVAFTQVGGFDGSIRAGEEPELCHRLHRAGWTIQCIDADMTFHDAAMTTLRQWWRRETRSGYGSLHVSIHAKHSGLFTRQIRSARIWALAWPAATFLLPIAGWFSGIRHNALIALLACLLFLALQMVRIVTEAPIAKVSRQVMPPPISALIMAFRQIRRNSPEQLQCWLDLETTAAKLTTVQCERNLLHPSRAIPIPQRHQRKNYLPHHRHHRHRFYCPCPRPRPSKNSLSPASPPSATSPQAHRPLLLKPTNPPYLTPSRTIAGYSTKSTPTVSSSPPPSKATCQIASDALRARIPRPGRKTHRPIHRILASPPPGRSIHRQNPGRKSKTIASMPRFARITRCIEQGSFGQVTHIDITLAVSLSIAPACQRSPMPISPIPFSNSVAAHPLDFLPHMAYLVHLLVGTHQRVESLWQKRDPQSILPTTNSALS